MTSARNDEVERDARRCVECVEDAEEEAALAQIGEGRANKGRGVLAVPQPQFGRVRL